MDSLNPDLQAYLEQCQAQGVPPEAVLQALRGAGWSETDVAAAQQVLEPEPLPPLAAQPPTTAPSQSTNLAGKSTFQRDPSSSFDSIWIIFPLFLLILAIPGYFFGKALITSFLNGSPVFVEQTSDAAPGTFANNQVSFTYPATWILKDYGDSVIVMKPDNPVLSSAEEDAFLGILAELAAADARFTTLPYASVEAAEGVEIVVSPAPGTLEEQVKEFALALAGNNERLLSSCSYGGKNGWCAATPASDAAGTESSWSFVYGTDTQMAQLSFLGASSVQTLSPEQKTILDSFKAL